MSVDFNALSQQFCTFYYDQFDKDRSQLGNLYVCMKFQETINTLKDSINNIGK